MQYLKGIVFDNQTMTPKAFARALERCLSDGILQGCGITFSGANVTLGAGYLLVKGRVIQVASAATEATSPTYANGYGRLKLSLDLSQTSSATINHQALISVEFASSETGFDVLTQDDINGSGTLYEIALAVFRYTNSQITSLTQLVSNVAPRQSLTASRSVVTDAGGNLIASDVTAAEIAFLDGVAGNIQTQLDAKQKIIQYGSTVPSGLSNGDLFLLTAE